MALIRNPLAAWSRRVLDWLCGDRADYQEFQARKRTRTYRANQTTCLRIWALAALLLLVCGSGGCLLTIALVATLSCLAILDPD